MLYLVSTPIGNLEDITLRALAVLRSVELILCEDPGQSKKLLYHYEIEKPLVSYHKFNEAKESCKVIKWLEEGKEIALISDAGTPLISDPGFRLIDELVRKGLPFTAIPGPCSIINGLLLSGLEGASFQWRGFLPKKEGEKREELLHALAYPGVTLYFEAPHRLVQTLSLLVKINPEVELTVLREMTKKFEERKMGSAAKLLSHFEKAPPKGEIVLALRGRRASFEGELSEILTLLVEEHQLSIKEAIQTAAKLLKEPKKKVYRYALDHGCFPD